MSRESHRREDEAAREWKGTYRPYDLVREATIALSVVLALTRHWRERRRPWPDRP